MNEAMLTSLPIQSQLRVRESGHGSGMAQVRVTLIVGTNGPALKAQFLKYALVHLPQLRIQPHLVSMLAGYRFGGMRVSIPPKATQLQWMLNAAHSPSSIPMLHLQILF